MNLNNANLMVDFFTRIISVVGSALMSEPYVYFTAVFLGICIVGIIKKIIY